MSYDEFCEMLGLQLRSKGWLITDGDSDYPDTSGIEVLGPHENLDGDTLFTVVVPKGVFEGL
jgi:hypothetical protein